MTTTSTLSTNYSTTHAVGDGNIKEDVSNVIQNISPVDTPFYSNIGRSKCSAVVHEWLLDELRDAAANTNSEGADVSSSYTAETAPSRVMNVCQILDELLEVSGTLEAVTLIGRKSETKYQLAKKMKELARDTEYALLNATYSATEPRQMRGLVDWLNDSTYYGTNCYYDFSAAYAASNDLTEDRFNTMIQAAWAEGGELDLVLAAPTQKRIISRDFDNSNKVTVNADQASKRIIAAVDYYESDFGTVRVVPERHWADDTDSGSYYDKIAFLNTSLWSVAELRPFKTNPMAKVGDSMRYQIIGEMTLQAKAPKGNALLAKLSRV